MPQRGLRRFGILGLLGLLGFWHPYLSFLAFLSSHSSTHRADPEARDSRALNTSSVHACSRTRG
jgi:hypothetical protein